MTTIFGYGAMTAEKQPGGARTPRELLDENSPLGLNWKTILAAAVQGRRGLGMAMAIWGCLGRSRGWEDSAGSFGGPAYLGR